ncbi:leukocyte receptor cluster member 1 homolog [Exaiptasia diaphana]|uniref:CBF1-interacting co-repressor CIR N-terminal domain-containing protein n=1 Tax=Exaiptasia diaphana TaxID=2652724 RepID=A0A913X268_EXADI|nr:leukocyte receptor cluster member 1 homolog [Exaiptasia diaphana]KXJ27337.1 Leukocyte receptor cluster member 1 [Exaiptasia diaphana]
MNILPHKSWHVRNKDNIERVRKDEEKARLEEEKRAKRAALADQEARTSLLRAKARSSSKESIATTSSEIVPVSDEPPRHINFFQDIEEGLRQGSNAEYEAEKKAEQEKQEKAIGLLTYLGQSASEKHGEKPWYEKKNEQKKTEQERDARDSKRKEALDPLTTMKKYLTAKEDFEKQKDKKHKKEHKKKKRKHKEKTSKKKSIEELRAERLKREQSERTREKALVSSSRGEKIPETEDNPYRYNSQFNPDFVRKPRNTGHQRHKPY